MRILNSQKQGGAIMAQIFIFDNNSELVRSMVDVFEFNDHEVKSNIKNTNNCIDIELCPVKILRSMLEWNPSPDVILIECLDVDSEKFLSMYKATSFSKNTEIIIMTDRYHNTKMKRLMKSYKAFCMIKPFNFSKIVTYIDELILI